MQFFMKIRYLLSRKQPAHEKIGVVDSQWIVHQTVPSLGNQVKQKSLATLHSQNFITLEIKHSGMRN